MSLERESGGFRPPVNILDLKPGMENVTVRVRVLEIGTPRTIETKKGTRTICNAVVGDATGRVDAVLWGLKTASFKEGDVVEISHAWVTEYRGKVQLNVGKSSEIKQLSGNEVPLPENIPEVRPKHSSSRPPFRGRPGFRRRGSGGVRSE